MQIDGKCHVLWVEMYCSQSLRQSSSETFILTALTGCSCAPNSINLEDSAFVFRLFSYSFHYFEPSRRNGRTFYLIPLLSAASWVDTTSPSDFTTKRMLRFSFRAVKPYESSKTDKKTLVWISSSKILFWTRKIHIWVVQCCFGVDLKYFTFKLYMKMLYKLHEVYLPEIFWSLKVCGNDK